MATREEIVDAIEAFAGQFDALETVERTPVIDLNAINPLSRQRERWTNVTSDSTEHRLQTAANTNDGSRLRTIERGKYVPGYEVQTGIGVRVPSLPTGDSEMRWGYYTTDSNNDPVNGFYFGADSTGMFVARARGSSVEKVYQSNWNRDTLDGSGDDRTNPSDIDLSIAQGHIFQIEFTYYGYGPIEMQVFMDQPNLNNTNPDAAGRVVTAHVFNVDGLTSIENTNLPIQQQIVSSGESNDALDLYVGGRQFAILGSYTTNARERAHYRSSLTGVDDTKWYAAISMTHKDGSGGADGSIDFRHVRSKIIGINAAPDTRMRYMIRRGTTPDNPSWTSVSDTKETETAMKVDTQSADVLDGSGNLTGEFVDSGVLESGGGSKEVLGSPSVDDRIPAGEPATLLFKAPPSTTGAVNDINLKWEEHW